MALLVMGMPFVGHAAVPDPFIYYSRLIGMPAIPNTFYGIYQTAVRVGNTPTLQVYVHDVFSGIPSISADLSGFGLSSSATTSGEWVGYGAQYYPAYFYNFGPLSVSTSTPDGIQVIPITAVDSMGGVATATASILVDNIAPSLNISNVTFSTTSPKHGDYMYLSGSANGTGSIAKISQLMTHLSDAGGNPVVSPIAGSATVAYDSTGINAVLATSTDGTFSNIPIRLLEFGDIGWISRAINLTAEIWGYDEAGNFASTSLTVPIPKTVPPDPCASGGCVSNVLFLPGIEGSRLYEGTGCGKVAEEKLWEPIADSFLGILRGAGDDKVKGLFLDQVGASICSDMYVKSGDIIDSVRGSNIYASLMNEMNGLKTDGTIKDWKPIAYDWRLSLDDLLTKGIELNSRIYYATTTATSTPYIEQTLRSLAASSKTGKVSIVAHSNGGLVAKALLNRLGSLASKSLVDKVIMVGAPQSGAPEALGVALVGHNAGIYKFGFPIVSNAVVRSLAQNSPTAYHLLPSQDYFDSVMGDAIHPVARFAGDGYAKEISAYGNAIGTEVELVDFLLARDGGRKKPATSDTSSAEILNPTLIGYATSTHAVLDSWTPPLGIEVSQIAGWGADTVAGIDFYTPPPISAASILEPLRKYKPIFTEDGDGTVLVPSALLMASSTGAKRYWVDLHSYNKLVPIKRNHRDLFEIPSLRDFIKNIITNSTSTLPSYIASSQPAPATENKKLTFFLHSPLTLQLTDASGNVTGLAEDGSMTQDIPDSSYGEFGEVKYVTVPQGSAYELTMHGQASGTFSLDMQESSGGVVTNASTIASVPTTASTLASLTISGGLNTASSLTVDENGDGKNMITITPKAGETVNYEPPAPAPESHSGSGGGGAYTLVVTPVPVATSTATASTSVPQAPMKRVATSTPEIATSPEITQVKRKIYVPIAKERQAVSPRPKEANLKVSQTASVYDASQQPVLNKLGAVVYYSLHRLWTGLQRIFHLK